MTLQGKRGHGVIMIFREACNWYFSYGTYQCIIWSHPICKSFKARHLSMFICTFLNATKRTSTTYTNVWRKKHKHCIFSALHSLTNLFPRKAYTSLFNGADKSLAFVWHDNVETEPMPEPRYLPFLWLPFPGSYT